MENSIINHKIRMLKKRLLDANNLNNERIERNRPNFEKTTPNALHLRVYF